MTTPTEIHDFEIAPEEFDRALGKLTRRFGQVEHLLALIIRRATGEPYDDVLARLGTYLKDRKKLISEARQSLRIWVEKCVEKKKFDEAQADKRIRDFDRVSNKLRNALDRRDELTHCAWGKDQNGELRATRRGVALIIDGQLAGQNHVEDTAVQLGECFDQLNQICPMSQDTQSEPTKNVVQSEYKTTFLSTGAAAPNFDITRTSSH